ncbi:MAG: hypothetical protein V1867_08430 [Candidatus Falkowbacteria bacterium]
MSERRKDFEKTISKNKPKKPKKMKGDGTDFSGFMAQVRNGGIKSQDVPENGTRQEEEKIDYAKKADEIRETVGMLEIKVNGDIPEEMSPFAAQIDGLAKAIDESSEDPKMQKALFEKLHELYERIKADNDLLRQGAATEEKRPDALTEETETEKPAESESAEQPQEAAEPASAEEKEENAPDGLVSKEDFQKAVARAEAIIAKDEEYLKSNNPKDRYKRRREIVWQEVVKLQNEEIADESGARAGEDGFEVYERMLEDYRGEGRKMILEKMLQEMNEDKSENHVLRNRINEELEKLNSQEKETTETAITTEKTEVIPDGLVSKENFQKAEVRAAAIIAKDEKYLKSDPKEKYKRRRDIVWQEIVKLKNEEKGSVPEGEADLTPEKTEEIIEVIARNEEPKEKSTEKIDTAKLAQEEARRQFYEETPREQWQYVSGPDDGEAKKAENKAFGPRSEWNEEIMSEIAWLEKWERAMEKEEKTTEYPGDEKNWAEEIRQEIVNLEKWEKIIEKDEAVLRDILSADKPDKEKEAPRGKGEEQKKTDEKNEKREKDSGISDHVFKRLKILGISPEDAKALKEVGLHELTEGQQLLAIANLKQLTLGRIQDEAALKYRKNAKEGGQVLGQVRGLKWLSKAWQGLSRHYQIAKFEKKSAKEIIGGGLEAHGAILKQLVAGLRNYGPDVDIIKKSRFKNADELKVRYVSAPETPNAKETEAYDKLNEAAAQIGEVPYEWSLSDATVLQKNRYQRAQKNMKARWRMFCVSRGGN